MSDAPKEVAVPVKVPEPQPDAPPTLAEPASGPVAEIGGSTTDSAKPDAASDPTESSSAPNGNNQPATSTEDKSAMATDKTTGQSTSLQNDSTAGPREGENDGPVPSDTEMKDAEDHRDAAAQEANGTSATKGKRKSTSGVPEHKNKTLKKKQSKQKITNLDAQPGDYFLARLRSFPPWPSIICDEEMLPDTLLKTRPVTAMQSDGTYKELYADDGKKAIERTYAVMFLSTNEFGWIPNTDLTRLDPASCKDVSVKGKSKALLQAYEVAAEGHDLPHFKEILRQHGEALEEEEQRRAERAAEKATKGPKKRKSELAKAASDEDVDMEDAANETKKSSKKRKKEPESDDEDNEKPAKTPKTKIKLNAGKTPNTSEKKTKEKATKPKKEKKAKAESEGEEADKPEETAIDPVQARKDREKEVLFLRHKLQKGFLARDQAPQEEEMPQAATYIKKLEAYGDKLEVSIIRNTKINKVLKGIVKLATIPKDEEYHFRERSVKLLGIWNQLLGAEPNDADKADKDEKADAPTSNGVHKEVEEEAKEPVQKEVEEPKDTTMSTEDAVDKISSEVKGDTEVKENAIEAVQQDDGTKQTEPVKAD